jgi:hypothetical protein
MIKAAGPDRRRYVTHRTPLPLHARPRRSTAPGWLALKANKANQTKETTCPLVSGEPKFISLRGSRSCSWSAQNLHPLDWEHRCQKAGRGGACPEMTVVRPSLANIDPDGK